MTTPLASSSPRQRGSTSPPRRLRDLLRSSRAHHDQRSWPAAQEPTTTGTGTGTGRRYDFTPGRAHLCVNLRRLLLPPVA